MNFDFLKELRGLGHIYENCSNAEKLVKTMPVQSVFTSRKSAELLAKFIYMAAHNKQMESMDFVDILNDYAVRDFINDRKIMNAFHSIRKSGNIAVHGDAKETPENAIDVLNNLHYVAGETACILGLIKHYPTFDDRIATYPEAQFVDKQEIEQTALQMFAEYVEKYNAQLERDNYYQHKIDKLTQEFDDIYGSEVSGITLVPNDISLNEILEFQDKPSESALKQIQAHFSLMGIKAIKALRGEWSPKIEGREQKLEAELTLFGEEGYSTGDLYEFVYGVLHDLPHSKGFKIKTKYVGAPLDPFWDAEIRSEFTDELEEIGKKEEFTYRYFIFYEVDGSSGVGKYEKGKWVDLTSRYSSDILDRDFGKDWWCGNLDLDVDFDFEKHSDIVEALHNVVRENIPHDQISYCENAWADGDVGILCNSISWCPRKLRKIQDFLDQLNCILKPIIAECEGDGLESAWYIPDDPIAVARWTWTKKGFKITGTCL